MRKRSKSRNKNKRNKNMLENLNQKLTNTISPGNSRIWFNGKNRRKIKLNKKKYLRNSKPNKWLTLIERKKSQIMKNFRKFFKCITKIKWMPNQILLTVYMLIIKYTKRKRKIWKNNSILLPINQPLTETIQWRAL